LIYSGIAPERVKKLNFPLDISGTSPEKNPATGRIWGCKDSDSGLNKGRISGFFQEAQKGDYTFVNYCKAYNCTKKEPQNAALYKFKTLEL
jgi:hypothetical protein